MPLLSGLKSSIAVLDNFADIELLGPKLWRVQAEIASLATSCKAFGRDDAAMLEVASMALTGS